MTGGFSHDPVTVATAQGIPVGLAGTVLANTCPRVRPFDHGIEPWGSWPSSQAPRVDLVDEAFLARVSKAVGCHLP